MKIIVAEDEPLMQKTIALRLKKDGHEVITTDNGREALELIATQNPDMVITDIMMPYASGLEIVGSVKSSGKKLPIIVLTAMGQENVVLEAFKLGADDFIAKPFSPN
jgi:DNA-binding response OmpR family regulator